jgi:energy-converting hydrogenase Eha subunit E
MDRGIVEIIGFFAAGMTVTAFYCTTMLTLRVAAVGANLLFIVYGSGLELKPVLALHRILLPLNIMRLIKVMRERRKDAPLNASVSRS